MKTLANDWLKALLNCVLLSAILLYISLPFWGLETWHRVVPEHDHLFVNGVHHHDESSVSDGTVLPAPQNIFNDCIACNSSQPSITVVHLPNPTGSMSVFALVIDFVALFTIAIPPSLAGRVLAFQFHAPVFISSPPDPPPNARS